MRHVLKVFMLTLAFSFIVNGQSGVSMNELLLPSADDLAGAKNQGFEVFRILPRGMFDYENNELRLRGGGAYYSFVNKSHSYNEIPQIQLEEGKLSVGFYGANYGLIADLGEIPLAGIDSKKKPADFLLKYQPKKLESEAREEYRKGQTGFETNGLKFSKTINAEAGHTYVLRAISYNEADTLVVFKVQRQDADGSLTVFWKLLKNFEKPILIQQKQINPRRSEK